MRLRERRMNRQDEAMTVHPRAGQLAQDEDLVDVAALVTAYYTGHPDVSDPAQRVAFGTSGHRGSSLANAFNDDHIAATTQAIVEYRKKHGINGPLYLGRDSHALSQPAWATALEVLAAHGVTVAIDSRSGLTPTPAISHAILRHNAGRATTDPGRADGIVSPRATTRRATGDSSTTRPTADRLDPTSPPAFRHGPMNCWQPA